MSIFEYAMQMEKDGEKFYRSLAEATANSGLKKIFNELADDEVEHYRIFKGLKEKTTLDISNSTVLADAKTIFEQMQKDQDTAVDSAEEQKKGYQLALEAEEKSYTFYEEKAAETDDPAAKKLLLAIAKEERRHHRLIENIIEFVSRPQTWLEDAEFVNLDQY